MGALLKLNADNFVEDKNVRDQYINKTEVLQKVKLLSLLPDNQHMTVKAVAEYYEVEYQTIINVLNRHKSEFEKDGVKTINNKDEGYFKVKEALSAGQFIVKLVPRKAILRVGMLLRDSKIAIKIRDYLLRIEETSTEDHKRGVWTDNDIVTLNEIVNNEISKGNSKWGAIRIAAKTFNKNPQAVYQKFQYISKRHGSLENYININNLVYFDKKSEELLQAEIQENNHPDILGNNLNAEMSRFLESLNNTKELESKINQLKLETRDMKHKLEIKDLELEAKTTEVAKKDKIISKLKKDKLALEVSIKAIRKIVLNGVKASNNEETGITEAKTVGHTYTRDKGGMIELKN